MLKPMATFAMLGVIGLVIWVVVGHASALSGGAGISGKPFLGMRLVDPDAFVARMFSIPPGEAVLIDHIVADSPASRAGLQRGDGILAVNGAPARTTGDISSHLEQAKGGDLLSLTVIRGGFVHDLMLPVESTTGP